MNTLKNVSVSINTMRREDLIPAFVATLWAIDSTMENPLASRLRGIEANMEQAEYYESEDSQYDLEWLFDILDMYAPDGYYFGAHPGDGSDYGFWAHEEDNQQEIDCPVCGSANAVSLGSLGTWLYYHCRDCGMDYSHENKSESGQALLIAIVLVGLGTLAIYIIFAPIFEALFAGLSF